MYRYPILLTIAVFICSCTMINNKSNLIVSGPMLGYIEHRSALIWLEVDESVYNVSIKHWEENGGNQEKTLYDGDLGNRFNPIKITLNELTPGTNYHYEILINGEKTNLEQDLTFKTKQLWEWRTPPPDFSFLVGSCNYLNDSDYDRPGKPYGQSTEIFNTMANTPTDFMLWLGDNIYYRDADLSSDFGLGYRNSVDRSNESLQNLLCSRPNYAIWDDHDFGPNDSNGSFELKDEALEWFKKYWGNKTYGEHDNPGIYSKFQWSDVEFFLLDNRYHRSSNNMLNKTEGFFNTEKYFLGTSQFEWLKNGLLSSEKTFKFIVCGGQILNPFTDTFESYRHYSYEFNELFTFLIDSRIEGVLFLSGDRHFSEALKVENDKIYDLYEYTSSPLTATPFHNFTDFDEHPNNAIRIANSLIIDQNFGKISVSGAVGNRQVKFETKKSDGETVYELVVNEKELKFEEIATQ